MITLKDIKISRSRIPVQNAIWLRPMGGMSFKLYCPQGDAWVEINVGSSPTPVPTDVEGRLENLEKEAARLAKYDSTLNQRIDNVLEMVVADRNRFTVKTNQLDISVQRLYSSVEITSLMLTREFPESQEPVEVTDPSMYGIDDVYLQAINDRTPTVVTFAGGPQYQVGYESNSWTIRGISHTCGILDAFRETENNVYTARWYSRRSGRSPQYVTYYYAHSMTYEKTPTTVILSEFDRNSLYDKTNKVLPSDLFPTPEQLDNLGLTIDTIRTLGQLENGVVFVGKEAIPYDLESETESGEGWEYYDIVLSCNDTYYNAKKVIRITAEIENSELGEVEILYDEEALPEPEED